MSPLNSQDKHLPAASIPMQALDRRKMKTNTGKGSGSQQSVAKLRRHKVFRPTSKAMRDHQLKEEAQHRRVKEEAAKLWQMLDNPVFDSPENPELLFSAEAVRIAKRGRRCTTETVVLGSNATEKAIRDFERSARRHGDENAEIERLREYPDALRGYQRILRRVKAQRR